MPELLADYQSTIYALGALSTLMLVQLLVADVAGLKAGHIPGAAITGGHERFLFRAARTVANINESIAIFLLAVLFCLFMGASPEATSGFCWLYLGARVAYVFCYYFNIKILRSISFIVSLIGIAGLLFIGFTS